MIDFSHIAAGPYATLQLGYFGAEVVKIESKHRLDGWRVRDGNADIEASRPFADHNKNKRSLTLNLKAPAGVELAKRLVGISDVVVENFSYGVMDRLGVGYDSLRAVKPDLIMASLQGLGSTGSRRDWVTWGAVLMPFSGLTHLWNLADAPEPVGSQTSYPDYVAALHAALAIMAALVHRDRTGEGRFIDLSQAEVTASLVGPAYMEYLVNGREPLPTGNSRPGHAPYGCYRCAGEDQWCSIAVTTDLEWRSFCDAIGRTELASAPPFATLRSRLAHRMELDALVSEWTRERSPREVMERLQAVGVPAGMVATGGDLLEDPHLAARGFLIETGHPRLGPLPLPGIAGKLSETPGSVWRHAPLLGQDNDYVLAEVLGLAPAERRRLVESGVVE